MTPLDIINKSNGKFLTIKFIKRSTGDIRTMTCRVGVSKGVTRKGMFYNPNDYNLKVVYEINCGFKCIPLDGIIYIKSKGEEYIF